MPPLLPDAAQDNRLLHPLSPRIFSGVSVQVLDQHVNSSSDDEDIENE